MIPKKFTYTTFILFHFAFCLKAQIKINKNYELLAKEMPGKHAMLNNFFVNELNQVFVPISGGVFMPFDSLWLIPPSKKQYITSFSTNDIDTSFYISSNTNDSSLFSYIKLSKSKNIIPFQLLSLKRGSYNLIYSKGVLFVWGFENNKSKIGIVTKKNVNWILNIDGIITQCQFNDKNEIFFSLGNTIYQLDKLKKVAELKSQVFGFCFDKSGKIICSTKDGIGFLENTTMNIIAEGINGNLQSSKNCIYLLPSNSNYIFKLTNK